MGAEQLYRAYRASGLTLEEFEVPRYQRIGHIKRLVADNIIDSELRHTRPSRHDESGEMVTLSALGARLS
jgi:hypothetical protein